MMTILYNDKKWKKKEKEREADKKIKTGIRKRGKKVKGSWKAERSDTNYQIQMSELHNNGSVKGLKHDTLCVSMRNTSRLMH